MAKHVACTNQPFTLCLMCTCTRWSNAFGDASKKNGRPAPGLILHWRGSVFPMRKGLRCAGLPIWTSDGVPDLGPDPETGPWFTFEPATGPKTGRRVEVTNLTRQFGILHFKLALLLRHENPLPYHKESAAAWRGTAFAGSKGPRIRVRRKSRTRK